jgi:hypothetical protein
LNLQKEGTFTMRKGTSSVVWPGFAFLAVAALLTAPGCFSTKFAQLDENIAAKSAESRPERPLEKSLEAQKRHEDALKDNAPAPAAVVKASPGPRETIIAKLREAEQIRIEVLNNPSVNSYYTKSELLDYKEDNLIRKYSLDNYRSNTDKMNKSRELYEEVLKMDPGSPQAQLGLGNLDLMDAASYVNEMYANEYYVGSDPGLTEKEKTQIKARIAKEQELHKMRTDAMLQAARSRFNAVLATSPQESSAHFGLAMAMAIHKEWPAAQAKFDQMERSGMLPQNYRSVFYVWYGFILEQQGNRDGARGKYAKATEYREPHQWGDWAQERSEMLYLFPPAKEYYTGRRF